MIDTELLKSFSECFEVSLLMQNKQEERVQENKMFYKYLLSQFHDPDQQNSENLKQLYQKLFSIKTTKSTKGSNGKNQSSIIYKQIRNICSDMQNIFEIYYKQNKLFHQRYKDLLSIFKEKLHYVHEIVQSKNQVYEIDIETQETRILNSEQKSSKVQQQQEVLDDNWLKELENESAISEEDFADQISYINPMNNNIIEVDFGFEDLAQQQQSFANSLECIMHGLNGIDYIEPPPPIEPEMKIIEPEMKNIEQVVVEKGGVQKQKQKQKPLPFQFVFQEEVIETQINNEKESNQSEGKNKQVTQKRKSQFNEEDIKQNQMIFIDMESKDEIQTEAPAQKEQNLQNQDNKQIPQTPPSQEKQDGKASNESQVLKGPLTRSATKKLAIQSPDLQKKQKVEQSTSEKQKKESSSVEKPNIWNNPSHISMNDAICISNCDISIEQEKPDIPNGEKAYLNDLLEIDSISLSSQSKTTQENKDTLSKKIVRKEVMKNSINNEGNKLTSSKVQSKQMLQIVKKNELEQFSSNLTISSKIQNPSDQKQAQSQISVKKEYIQSNSNASVSQANQIKSAKQQIKNHDTEKNINQDQESKMDLEKDVIILSPMETNIQSISRLSSQISLNNSCYIVGQKKLGKKITKANNKNSPKQNSPQKNCLSTTASNQSSQVQTNMKLLKRKIIRN